MKKVIDNNYWWITYSHVNFSDSTQEKAIQIIEKTYPPDSRIKEVRETALGLMSLASFNLVSESKRWEIPSTTKNWRNFGGRFLVNFSLCCLEHGMLNSETVKVNEFSRWKRDVFKELLDNFASTNLIQILLGCGITNKSLFFSKHDWMDAVEIKESEKERFVRIIEELYPPDKSIVGQYMYRIILEPDSFNAPVDIVARSNWAENLSPLKTLQLLLLNFMYTGAYTRYVDEINSFYTAETTPLYNSASSKINDCNAPDDKPEELKEFKPMENHDQAAIAIVTKLNIEVYKALEAKNLEGADYLMFRTDGTSSAITMAGIEIWNSEEDGFCSDINEFEEKVWENMYEQLNYLTELTSMILGEPDQASDDADKYTWREEE